MKIDKFLPFATSSGNKSVFIDSMNKKFERQNHVNEVKLIHCAKVTNILH